MSEEDYQNNIGVWDGQPVIETPEFTKEERKKALEIGEKFVMKYISKKEFGPVIGTIAYWVWLPKPTRGIMKKIGIKTWAILRLIKNSMLYRTKISDGVNFERIPQ